MHELFAKLQERELFNRLGREYGIEGSEAEVRSKILTGLREVLDGTKPEAPQQPFDWAQLSEDTAHALIERIDGPLWFE
jgi:hypothetical protein